MGEWNTKNIVEENCWWSTGLFPLYTWLVSLLYSQYTHSFCSGGCRGRDRMIVGFTTSCAISVYHLLSCEFEPRSWRSVLGTTLCDKFVSDLRHVGGFLSGFLHWYNWNIVESGVKHHKPKPNYFISVLNFSKNWILLQLWKD
jgi:hypothetical protein